MCRNYAGVFKNYVRRTECFLADVLRTYVKLLILTRENAIYTAHSHLNTLNADKPIEFIAGANTILWND